ncbi:SUMF1/EgtB/PvdO family nonheme iron enzyme [Chryseolinea sp. T2]|uniref:formylglycine-generating enzyme family protein n=1 Tax=Chryseolinea sp. T2 TaxID=3129255 RepID=UPI003077C1A0
MTFSVKTSISFLLILASIESLAQEFQSYEQAVPQTEVKFKMIAIPAGSYLMGSSYSEPGREDDEGPQRNVTVDAFWMEEHEVTFAEWDAFFKNMDVPQTKAIALDAVSRPTAQYIDLTWGMGRDDNQPSNSMSQAAAIMYCKWLYNKTGIFFRLPTEAEWEYACRAGSKTAYSFGDDASVLKSYAYNKDNSASKFHKVRQLKPNAWGLYDMLGNLSEWTLDQYNPKAYDALADGVQNPLTPPGTRYPRVVRGGSYQTDAAACRCANRISSLADWNKRDPQIPKSRWWLTDGMTIGFRVVRPKTAPSKDEIEKFYAQYLK